MRALPSSGSTEWRKLRLDFSLFLAGYCSHIGYRRTVVFLLCFSSWDETARLICGGGGNFAQHVLYRSSTVVGFRHPYVALQTMFRTGSIFGACDDLLQTEDA